MAFAGNRAEALRTETENLSISRRTTGSRSPAEPRRLRSSDAHKRIAAPKAFCVLLEHTRPKLKTAKFAVLPPGHAGLPNRVKRSEGSDTTPRHAHAESLERKA